MAADAQNRRSILQGLQQTRSRLQKLQEDRSPSPIMKSNLPVPPQPSQPRLTPPLPQDCSKQQKFALQQAMSQSHGYYVSEPSPYGNYLIPVLPRFDSDGKLVPMS
ncbi:PREDICTED: SOSS complex subunit C-like isoform X1 [Amphimedon queenslandica]|nr:PREDICTED: SOSS complex subunit C-like isoform X1 [Amphimedon queenslandica]|eukprot:XP_019853967.1 PREDICTED: SOSS complex subunit C-like isoform X1 [Amphimedon queenslandica]